MKRILKPQRVCGREFNTEEISLIKEIASTCKGLSRRELGLTVCELLQWQRPGGGLKERECQDLLVLLESKGILKLPMKRQRKKTLTHKNETEIQCLQPFSTLSGSVEDFAPLDIQKV